MHAHQQCPARLRSRPLGPSYCAPAIWSVSSRPARLRHAAVTAAVASIRPTQQAAAARTGKRVRKQEQPIQLPEDYGDLPDPERQLLEAQALAEGLEAVYHAKARQVKRMLTPERVQQLQQELSEEDLEALQVILDDIQGLVDADAPGQTQEQLDAAAEAAEAALMQHLESGPPPIPADFNSYVLQAMPPGTTLAQVEQQLQLLPPAVLVELQQLYEELKAFSTSSLASTTAAATYLDLSERMGSMANKLEQWEAGPHTTTSSSSSSSSNSSSSSTIRSSRGMQGTSANSSSSSRQPGGAGSSWDHRQPSSSNGLPAQQQQQPSRSPVAVSRFAGRSSSASSSSSSDMGGLPRARPLVRRSSRAAAGAVLDGSGGDGSVAAAVAPSLAAPKQQQGQQGQQQLQASSPQQQQQQQEVQQLPHHEELRHQQQQQPPAQRKWLASGPRRLRPGRTAAGAAAKAG